MLRRIYLLFPQRKAVEQVVTELQEIGVSLQNLHTIAQDGVDISGLPLANTRQKADFSARLESMLWNLNLAVFFIALLVLVAASIAFSITAIVLSLLIMIATFTAGNYFASHVPHAHLDECRGAIRHGEILLLVDVPRWKLREVESHVHRHHPDMVVGGVTWTLQGL
jgi:hypothetical protein